MIQFNNYPLTTAPASMPGFESREILPFNIQLLNDEHFQADEINNSSRIRQYYQILWIKSARGSCLVDMQQFAVKGNTVFFIQPGQLYHTVLDELGAGYLISFTYDFLYLSDGNTGTGFRSNLMNLLAGNIALQVKKDLDSQLSTIVCEMTREFNSQTELRSEILQGLLKIFFIYLSRQSAPLADHFTRSRNADLVQKFIALLDKHFLYKKMVSDYASELCVTANYLNEVVKKVSGFPAGFHIRQRIALEAKRRATYTNASMKEVAYYLGFDDIAHFSKFFKNVSGMNFTDFKKGHLNQLGLLNPVVHTA